MRKLNLGKNLTYILNTLQEAGFEAYLVGGYVRDKLLQRNTNDADITTNALPQQIQEVFAHLKTIDIGKAYGTIVVVYKKVNYEITTYRHDTKYTDHRHPDKIRFSKTLKEDLKRRDFTINALAYNEQEGFIDYHEGYQDLQNKIIRAIGDPEKRFNEDALRILRAIRFSSQLYFKIEPKTAYEIHHLKNTLNRVSKERCNIELSKLLLSDYCENVLFQYKDVLELFFKNLLFLEDKEYIKRIELLKHAPKNLALRYGILLNKIDNALFYLSNLKYDKKLIQETGIYLTHYLDFIEPSSTGLKAYLSKLPLDIIKNLIYLQQQQETITEMEANRYYEIIDMILKEKQCYCLKDLAINGNDLKKLGYKGKDIGNTLKDILERVIQEKLENNYYEIIEYLKK